MSALADLTQQQPRHPHVQPAPEPAGAGTPGHIAPAEEGDEEPVTPDASDNPDHGSTAADMAVESVPLTVHDLHQAANREVTPVVKLERSAIRSAGRESNLYRRLTGTAWQVQDAQSDHEAGPSLSCANSGSSIEVAAQAHRLLCCRCRDEKFRQTVGSVPFQEEGIRFILATEQQPRKLPLTLGGQQVLMQVNMQLS